MLQLQKIISEKHDMQHTEVLDIFNTLNNFK